MAIETGVIQEVVRILAEDSDISYILKKTRNGQIPVRPGHFVPVDAVFPQITVAWKNVESEPQFPAEMGDLYIVVWLDIKHKEPIKTLENIKDYIITLFNRHGEVHNNIDVSSNTGIRFNQFLKKGQDCDLDEVIKKYYCELIFRVCVSDREESFDPSDSGDQSWV